MDNKCSKYEGLFIFSDKESLEKHLNECEECRLEHEKMQKVSDLIGEVKFYYKKKQKKIRKMKAVCAALFMVILSTGVYTLESDYSDALLYGHELSAEDLGFPVDSYGLIMVDE